MKTKQLCIGVVGAGLFAYEYHLPALQTLAKKFRIKAICDVNHDAAKRFADALQYPVILTSRYEDILCDNEIDAVDIALPHQIMPDVIMAAIVAEKNIFSEKPIAPDTATARALIQRHQAHPDSVWIVAENWRHEPAIRQAAKLITDGAIGSPLLFHWVIHYPILPGHKYYKTEWRRSADAVGGYILDGGVHHLAALRVILGNIVEVSAMVAKMKPGLPFPDTLCTSIRIDNGVIGSYIISYAGSAPWPAELRITGDKGVLAVSRDSLSIQCGEIIKKFDIVRKNPLISEFEEYYQAICSNREYFNHPEEALIDLDTIEAVIRSSETGNAIKLRV